MGIGEPGRRKGWAANHPSLGGAPSPVNQGQPSGRPPAVGTMGAAPRLRAGPGTPASDLAPQAEYDAMLLEHAGEAIPALAAAAGGDAFAPFFAGFLPLLLCKTVSALFS